VLKWLEKKKNLKVCLSKIGCLDYIFYNDQFIVDKVDKIFEEKP